MKTNVILHGAEAAEKLIKGADLLANSVKVTLGPWGGNVISGVRGNVIVTNDGKRIADLINSEDEIENLGIRTMREALDKTNEGAGDGTTSSITIAQAIIKSAQKFMRTGTTFKGTLSPVALKDKIEEEAAVVIEELKKQSKKVESVEELVAVAQVSVENENLAELIGGTQWDIGPEGVIIPEESNDHEDSIERIKGVRFDNGYGTTLVLNNLEKGTLEVKGARVILTNYVLSGNKAFAPLATLLEQLVKSGVTDVVIVARAFSSEAIQLCMENHKQGFRMYPINAPYTDQTEVMKDLAALTGATFVNNEDMKLENLMLSGVGNISKMVSDRFSTIFTGVDNEQTQKTVGARVQELKETLAGSQSSFEKKHIESRISQLQNGFALLKVTGKSLVERKYKFDKAEDCCNSVRAALQEGTVPGAGIALKTAGNTLKSDAILKDATNIIYKQIMDNAGQEMEVPEWVRDPVKVVRIGVEKAASVAAQFATAVVAINTKNDPIKFVQETPQNTEES